MGKDLDWKLKGYSFLPKCILDRYVSLTNTSKLSGFLAYLTLTLGGKRPKRIK